VLVGLSGRTTPDSPAKRKRNMPVGAVGLPKGLLRTWSGWPAHSPGPRCSLPVLFSVGNIPS
jgi:hypothetical protein